MLSEDCSLVSKYLGDKSLMFIYIYVRVFLLFVHVFLLLSMYSYCCLRILIVVHVFLDAATLTEVFRAFSSVIRQMPGYN